MTDELSDLLGRTRQLEQENASLRSRQTPGGDDADLRSENVMLRHELELLRAAPGGSGAAPATVEAPAADAADEMPRTLADFSALPQTRRELVARSMTRQQRDELLGRNQSDDSGQNYL